MSAVKRTVNVTVRVILSFMLKEDRCHNCWDDQSHPQLPPLSHEPESQQLESLDELPLS
jgi:hypothetical protein